MTEYGLPFDFTPPPTPSINFSDILSTPAFNIPLGEPNLNIPNLDRGGTSWADILHGVNAAGSSLKDLLGTGLNIKSQIDNAAYKRSLADYYKNRNAAETAYNAEILQFQKDRQAYQDKVLGMYQDFFTQFEGGFQDFSSQVSTIMNQQVSTAMDQLHKANQLQEPAIAALARGEVPASMEPVLDQFKARARAAAMQNFAAQGIDVGTGEAAITQQIDQAAMVALQQWATATLQGAGGLVAAGTGQLTAAEGSAAALLDPIAKEFGALQSALTGLLGGSGGLAPAFPPPAAVASA